MRITCLSYIVLMCSFWICLPPPCFARDVSVKWTANTEPEFAMPGSGYGYKIHYKIGSATEPFNGTGAVEGPSPVDVNNVTTATLTGLDPALNYFLAATAYNDTGVESLLSDVVVFYEITPPTVSITSPANNQTVIGNVSVAVDASDASGIAKVELYVDNILQGTINAAPYNFAWDTAIIPAKNYTITAKAYDTVGNVALSSVIQVTVTHDNIPPAVAIISPSTNALARDNVAVLVNATDNIGVDKVELYANNTLRAISYAAPFTLNWDSLLAAGGTYDLIARAYDKAGNMTDSSSVRITLDNAPPILTFNKVVSPTILSSQTLSGTVTDNLPGSTVKVKVGTTPAFAATVSGSSWSYNTNLVLNNNPITITATDAAGNTTTAPVATITRYHAGASNTNGTIVIADALLALKYSLGLTSPTTIEFVRSDVAPIDMTTHQPKPDGRVDIDDVIVMLRRAVGLSW